MAVCMECRFSPNPLVLGQNGDGNLFDRGLEKNIMATGDLLYNVDMHDD